MDVPTPHFNLWVPALETGLLSLSQLIRWADGQIERLAQPPLWLLELSLATDVGGVRKAWDAVPDRPASEPAESHDPREIHLGLLYLDYEAGRLPLTELLLRAGDYADGNGYGGAVPECEAFYLLLNEAEGRSTLPRGVRPLEERVRQLFAPIVAKARATLPYLRSVGGAE
jgi:hypothetical protein